MTRAALIARLYAWAERIDQSLPLTCQDDVEEIQAVAAEIRETYLDELHAELVMEPRCSPKLP
jgi:hypothetical protein